MTDAAGMTEVFAGDAVVDELAQSWLAELRRDPVHAVEGLQLSLAAQRGGSPQWLADLAMSMSEDHRRAEPDDPSAEAWCDYCGATSGLDETDPLGTGTVPCTCHGMVTRPCRDTDACVQRREERYPPDLARVPSWVLDTHRSLSEEEAAGALVRAAATAAARAYYLELVQAAGDEEIGLSGPPAPLPGWQATPSGAWDTRGDFIPVNFNWAHWNWRHTIRGGARMSHAISGGAPPPGGSGARLAALRAARAQQLQGRWQAGDNPPPYGSEPARDGPQGTGGTAAGQGRREIPAEGVPEGVRAVLEGRWAGGDVPLGQAGQAAAEPVAAPLRPGQQRAPAPRRRGRALRYSPARPARKSAQHPPGDSGWGSAGEGPSGGGSET